MKIDSHTHSKFSHDSKIQPEEMVRIAFEKGVKYLAITDHCDRDCLFGDFSYITQIDLEGYTKKIEELKNAYEYKGLYIAMGIELGYDKRANDIYIKDLSRYKFDVIINSVHNVNLEDIYKDSYFKGRSKEEAYELYLKAVLESLDAPYDYDIVGHLGYVMRNSPYEDNLLVYNMHKETIDKILSKIIEKNKTLEINSRVKKLKTISLPDKVILNRYKELGGDNITFGSDAHWGEVIAHNYEQIAIMAKELGFTHWTIYKNRVAERVEI